MTPSTREIDPFDVLIARVEFEDKPGTVKSRPVIVATVDDDRLCIIAVKVTSHAPRGWCPGEVALKDWELAGLVKPSVARCSKLLMLRADDIKLKVGALSARDRAEVSRWLCRLR